MGGALGTVCRTAWSMNCTAIGEIKIKPRHNLIVDGEEVLSDMPITYTSDISIVGQTYPLLNRIRYMCGGVWDEITNELTEIMLSTSGGIIYGRVKLFEVAQTW
jgi:hypothetical protein